ncbi:Rv3654c family TadE-like protein [Nocardioides pantholopis]|uniref:Rv3654c family TadE-like protein n=1 Tax=Nocardioides pantholopis TaxID=2483798 RepID=UPI001F49AC6C|nr:Rv3654c family TadE-like protein [Nocardioides pantholopis]
MTGSPARDERGSASLMATACLGVLLLVGAGLGVVAAMVVAHRQAQAAADLAALAAAQDVARGGSGCGAGLAIAQANDASVLECRVDGRDVRLRVSVRGPRWLGQDGDLVAEARAGPA